MRALEVGGEELPWWSKSTANGSLRPSPPTSAGCIPGTPLPSGMWQVAQACAYSFAPTPVSAAAAAGLAAVAGLADAAVRGAAAAGAAAAGAVVVAGALPAPV